MLLLILEAVIVFRKVLLQCGKKYLFFVGKIAALHSL